jgi:dephospho-CoA kinase
VTLAIGLTGGIASGKSLVGELFRQRGVTVIDADLVARDVVAPGHAGLDALTREFGTGILGSDGSLDRRRMRERVFGNDAERRRLEEILHPLIRDELARRRAAAPGDYCVLMVPLLVRSTGMRALVDRVLVVDAPEEAQLSRLMARDSIDAALGGRMIAAQETRAERLAAADDVIRNDGHPDVLEASVERLHRGYLALAHGKIRTLPPQHLPLSGSD